MSPVEGVVLFVASAVASGINSVAGGGSLISYPLITTFMGPGFANLGSGYEKMANATNSVGLFPGSLAGGIGFGKGNLAKTGVYFRKLLVPTILGSIGGGYLLLMTPQTVFRIVIPFLILLASLLLWFQPKVKAMLVKSDHHVISPWFGMILQFFVAVYGGYFGAGMGIMMLASFALYMDGTTHELNAVKSWLGTIINLTCSIVFLMKGLVVLSFAWILVIGSIVGGFLAARMSLKVDPDKLRTVIAIYGFVMTVYFFAKIFS